jgi:hypothetical protein
LESKIKIQLKLNTQTKSKPKNFPKPVLSPFIKLNSNKNKITKSHTKLEVGTEQFFEKPEQYLFFPDEVINNFEDIQEH